MEYIFIFFANKGEDIPPCGAEWGGGSEPPRTHPTPPPPPPVAETVVFKSYLDYSR